MIAANTNTAEAITVFIVIDKNLNTEGRGMQIVFPFSMAGTLPGKCETSGDLRTIKLTIPAGNAFVVG